MLLSFSVRDLGAQVSGELAHSVWSCVWNKPEPRYSWLGSGNWGSSSPHFLFPVVTTHSLFSPFFFPLKSSKDRRAGNTGNRAGGQGQGQARVCWIQVYVRDKCPQHGQETVKEWRPGWARVLGMRAPCLFIETNDQHGRVGSGTATRTRIRETRIDLHFSILGSGSI